jgi:hypothetical protein
MDSNQKISGYQSSVFSRTPLKQSFIIAVVIGTFFTLLGAKTNSTLMGFVFPVIVISIYCFIVVKGSIDVPRVVAGDSCYYLGFIFTLVSLIASLWLISSTPEHGQVNFSQIVSSFGVALVTTVIGLIMRLIITTFDIETKQRQEQIERDIEQSLDTFKGQIDVLVSTVTSSVIKVSSHTEQTILDTLKQYEKVNNNILQKLESSFDENQSKYSIAIDKLTDKVNTIEVSQDLITKPVLASIKELTDNLSNFSKSFTKAAKQLQSNNEQLANHIATSTDTINIHINAFETKLSSVISEQADQYHHVLSEIGDAVLANIGDIKDIKFEAEKDITEKTGQITSQFESLSKAIDKTVPTLTASLTMLIDQTSMIQTKMGESPQIIEMYVNSLSELSEKFKLVSADLPELNNINDKLSAFESLLEVSSKRTLETYKRFDETAFATEGYTTQIAKDISTVYTNLAQEIQKLRGVTV